MDELVEIGIDAAVVAHEAATEAFSWRAYEDQDGVEIRETEHGKVVFSGHVDACQAFEDRERLKAALRAALTALEAKGYGIIGPKRDGVANYADVALQDAQVEHYSGGEKIWIYDDALLLKSLAGNGFSIGPTVLHGKEEKQATRSSEDGRATAPITTGN